MRLRTKLLVAYVAVVVPLFAAFGVWTYIAAQESFGRELGDSLRTAAAIVAAGYAGNTAGRIARLEPDSEAMRQRLRAGLESVRAESGLSRVRLMTPAMESLVDTAAAEPLERYFDLETDEVEVRAAVESGRATDSLLFWGADGLPYKRGYAPVVHEGQVVAVVCVERPASYYHRLRDLRAELLGFGVGLLVVTVFVSHLIARRIAAPLTELAQVARSIGEGGSSVPISATGDDEVGQLAGALRAMQRGLAARDQESQMMLAGIAHEVRNPLGGMELFLGMLEDALTPGSDALEHARRVRRELAYLARVVDEFLAFARDRPLRLGRAQARAALEAAADCARAAAPTGVTIEVDAAPELELCGDIDALRGVFVNLIQNAAQASPPGARVRVLARAPSSGTREVRVRDEGQGMTPEVLAQVLRPFYTTREKGTGLGLPLANKLVLRHGGTLAIESIPGSGTEVIVTLPFLASAPPVPTAAPPPSAGLDATDYDGEMIG